MCTCSDIVFVLDSTLRIFFEVSGGGPTSPSLTLERKEKRGSCLLVKRNVTLFSDVLVLDYETNFLVPSVRLKREYSDTCHGQGKSSLLWLPMVL